MYESFQIVESVGSLFLDWPEMCKSFEQVPVTNLTYLSILNYGNL